MLENISKLIPKITLDQALELFEKKELIGPFYLSNKDYHAAPGLSKSALDNIEESPKYYKYKLSHPDNLSEALIFGSAYHAEILKDEPLDSIVYITKTQPQKPERDDKGRSPLSEKNLERIKGMTKAFQEDPLARNLVKDALIEVSFFWVDPETEILCKCKPDLWWIMKCLVGDLKTTTDVTPKKFKRTVRDFRYEVQGAFILDGIRHACQQKGIELGSYFPTRFADIAQEKAEPYDIGFFPLGPRTLFSGEVRYKRNLATYAECLRTGVWNGKQPRFEEIELEIYDLEEGETV